MADQTTQEAFDELRATFRDLLAPLPGMALALRWTNRLAVKLGFGDDGTITRLGQRAALWRKARRHG